MRRLALLMLLALSLRPGPVAAAEMTGAASPIGKAFCGPSGKAGEPLLRCPGPAGIEAYIHEDGERVSVSLGDPVEGFASIGSRNRLGQTMEWRSLNGRPFAGILRFRLPDAEDGREGDILAILKVADAERPGCLVAMVDATVNPDARAMVRRIADEQAPAFSCGADEPRFFGVSSDWARNAVAAGGAR